MLLLLLLWVLIMTLLFWRTIVSDPYGEKSALGMFRDGRYLRRQCFNQGLCHSWLSATNLSKRGDVHQDVVVHVRLPAGSLSLGLAASSDGSTTARSIPNPRASIGLDCSSASNPPERLELIVLRLFELQSITKEHIDCDNRKRCAIRKRYILGDRCTCCCV